eukprot:GHVN01015375.1.p1 GENE.GHVN01015375.1~~GHVN01015375.1.p1  ORF type:complete len:339 (-),score=41.08 GHVN01015375.1:675-1691(-)
MILWLLSWGWVWLLVTLRGGVVHAFLWALKPCSKHVCVGSNQLSRQPTMLKSKEAPNWELPWNPHFPSESKGIGPLGITPFPTDRRPYFKLRDDQCLEIKNVTAQWKAERPEWIDYIEMEKKSWMGAKKGSLTPEETQDMNSTLEDWARRPLDQANKMAEFAEKIERGEESLNFHDAFEQLRKITRRHLNEPITHFEPRRMPRLWLIQPKEVYCELLKKDGPRLKSLVKRIRSTFKESELEIVRAKIDDRVPLCEVYITGPVLHNMQVFYARGGTLQYMLPASLRTSYPRIEESADLKDMYGGPAYLGGFPVWNEDNIFKELVSMLRPSYLERHVRGV